MKIIILTPRNRIFYPFILYKKYLLKKYSIDIQIQLMEDSNTEQLVVLYKPDVIAISESFKRFYVKGDFAFYLNNIKSLMPHSKIIFFDDRASSGECSFQVLPYVDAYVKKSLLRDKNQYKDNFIGGSIYIDYIVKKLKLTKNTVPKINNLMVLNKDDNERKIILGWNVGVFPEIHQQFKNQQFKPFKNNKRIFDLVCRINPQTNWLQKYRLFCLTILHGIHQGNILATSENKPLHEYWEEMRHSKMVFSPFGLGEVCYRDFEAIFCGSLLLKPSMEHIQTEPNIYKAFKTYIPIKWDLSDLKEKYLYYKDHHKERDKIIYCAAKEYGDYFNKNKFIDQLLFILKKVM